MGCQSRCCIALERPVRREALNDATGGKGPSASKLGLVAYDTPYTKAHVNAKVQ